MKWLLMEFTIETNKWKPLKWQNLGFFSGLKGVVLLKV